MKFIELQQYFKNQKIFSTKDLETTFGHRFKNNLLNWQKKGYIKKIIKGWYYLNDKQTNQSDLYQIANRIYKSSYVSLEYVLNIYNIIPEGIFNITNITSKPTRSYNGNTGSFDFLQKDVHNFLFNPHDKSRLYFPDLIRDIEFEE